MSLTIIIVFTLGLIVGSFLNVVIYRLPRHQSIIFPASHCPSCKTELKWYDLIPLISYLLLKGRCRYCGEKISPCYPAVELLTALVFAFIYYKYGLTPSFFIYSLLFSGIISCSVIDLQYKVIPNQITYSGIIIGLILAIFFNHISFISSLLGGLIPAGLLLLIAFIYKKGMGLGDVKLVAMIGVFLGWEYTLLGIFMGSLIGSIVGITLILLKKMDRETRIPFGPFISFGILIIILFGDYLLGLYLKYLF